MFQRPDDDTSYCALLQEAFLAHAVHLAHFCLMPNHVHLLAYAEHVAQLSGAMHQLQRRYWFYVRRQYGWTGHLWQGRFHSFPIEVETYPLEAARYIERNPLEARLVTSLEEYPWSSYRYYVTGQLGPLPLVPTPVYEALGATALQRQQAYRRFVETPHPSDRAVRRTLERVAAYA